MNFFTIIFPFFFGPATNRIPCIVKNHNKTFSKTRKLERKVEESGTDLSRASCVINWNCDVKISFRSVSRIEAVRFFVWEEKRVVTMGKIVILITVMAILLQLTALTYARKHEGKFQRCSQMFQRRYFFLADDNSEKKMCERILTFISVKRFPMTYGAIRFHLLQKRLFNSVATRSKFFREFFVNSLLSNDSSYFIT